jgi:hypothetical protein
LHRIKGELVLARGELAAAVEPWFETAIAIAREQSAKSWELRATVSHARLLKQKASHTGLWLVHRRVRHP